MTTMFTVAETPREHLWQTVFWCGLGAQAIGVVFLKAMPFPISEVVGDLLLAGGHVAFLVAFYFLALPRVMAWIAGLRR